MARKLAVFALIVALFGAISSPTAQAAITYASWYTSVGANSINFPYHTTGPNQVTLNWDLGAKGHAGGGGEFRVGSVLDGGGPITYIDSQLVNRNFTTFCLEQNEHVYLGAAYDISIDPAAYYGANQAPDGDHDNLDASTAVLYGAYFDGSLAARVGGFSYNSDASADAFQKAVWAIEDSVVLGVSDVLAQALKAYGEAIASAVAGQAALDRLNYVTHVGVMNLWVPSDLNSLDSPAKSAQSQLMWLPDAPQVLLELTPTPEPATLVIWVIGIAASAGYRASRRTRLNPTG
jgi:hypothetical protein